MLNLISICFGLLALALALVGLVPLLGWLNWMVIPLAVVGGAFGAMSAGKAGRNLNIFVVVVGAVRLFLGGGIF